MKKYRAYLAAFLVIASVPICSAGQQSAARQPGTQSASASKHRPLFSVDAPAERIHNLDILKKEVRQYHDCTCKCGCYTHDLDLQADRAIAFLRRRAAHIGNEKLALVLDIDETSLSNYQEMDNADFAYNKQVFDAWVNTSKAPAIPGTLRIFKEAQRLGVHVFFITGRPDGEETVTEKNLIDQGFQNWEQLTLRPASTASESVDEYKSNARAQIVAQGYKIVLNVGDQWSDLKGKPEAELSVKYPDPFYFIP